MDNSNQLNLIRCFIAIDLPLFFLEKRKLGFQKKNYDNKRRDF
jgi:hypothetical protein